MKIIKIEELNKYYNKGKENELHVLKNLSFEVEKGELLAIMGESGCGKTTFLNILGCIDNFDSGNYILTNDSVCNLNDSELSKLRCQKIGFVLQDFALIENETVLENIKTPLYFDAKKKIKTLNSIAMEALRLLKIEDLSKKKVLHLSGGQKQRVAIARAMVNKPDLILADEPTGSLDSKTSIEIMEVLKHLNKNGTTIILVTHDINIAQQCERIVRMKDGILS